MTCDFAKNWPPMDINSLNCFSQLVEMSSAETVDIQFRTLTFALSNNVLVSNSSIIMESKVGLSHG